MNNSLELTILMPCLNEAETLAICIRKAKLFLINNNINGEILIADNGSTDGSQEIALSNGARVVNVKERGYGNALRGGIDNAYGVYLIMGDADDSYDFLHLERFIEKLHEGFDLVMGNRFKGGIEKGAMPFLHRYLGNPVLSFFGRLFFESVIRDFHCGLRGFITDRIKLLSLRTSGMELASEMVVKATLNKFKITEVPTTLKLDGRSHPPHLNTWRDGWRHLVFLLLYSPNWLFLFPAITMFALCLVLFIVLLFKSLYLQNVGIDIHTMSYIGFGIIISFQLMLFALLSRIYATNAGLLPIRRKTLKIFKFFTLERGILVGIVMLIIGVWLMIKLLLYWHGLHFGPISEFGYTFRLLIPSAVLLVLGIQTIFSSFLFRLFSTIQNITFIDKK